MIICNMMKHSTRGHEVEGAALHRTSNDVALAQLKIGRTIF
jgi:hypothetical protein